MDGAIPEASLRMSLFTKYGQLQMWLLSRIVWYAAVFYLVTLVAFAVLRLFTGISIKRIGYFNLRHIVLTPKQGVEIRIGKLGLSPHRPTVARPGLFTFIVSNLEILVDLDTIIKHEPPHEKAAAAQKRREHTKVAVNDLGPESPTASGPADPMDPDQSQQSPPDGPAADKSSQSSQEDAGQRSFTRGIPLVPKKSPAFKILRWVIQTLRVFDFQMVSTAIALSGLNSTIATSISLRVDVRKTRNLKASNFKGTLDTYKLSDHELPLNAKLHITDVYAAESLDDESPWQVFEDLKLDVLGVLDLKEMCLKELGAQLHAGRLQLDVAHVIEILEKVKALRQQKVPAEEKPATLKTGPEGEAAETATDKTATDEESKAAQEQAKVLSAQDQQRMVKGAMMLLHLVNRVQLTLGALEVLRVPVMKGAKDPVFFALSMKDFNLDLSRMNPLSSGFKLLYDEGDVAHQAILTVASLTAGIDTGSEQEELIYIPMLTSLTRGNMFSKTLRFVQDDNGDLRNESTIRSRWSFHSPNLSIEQRQLATLMRVILAHAEKSEEKKNAKKSKKKEVEPESHADTPDERSKKAGKITIPFAKSLPKLDIDFTVSDPALRLVCDSVPKCEDAMFVSSCQRMFASLTSRHHPDTGTYGAQLTCETAENQVWYRSAKIPRFDVSESQSTSLTVQARASPYLEVEIDGSHTGFGVTALHHEIFYAIGLLQRTISRPLKAFRAQHPKLEPAENTHRDLMDDDPNAKAAKVKVGPLRKIPSAITRMRFTMNSASASFATNRFRDQSNEIMGLMFSTDFFEILYHTKLTDINLNTSSDGRRVTVRGDNIGLYKLDKMFLDPNRRDEGVVARNTICLIPKLCSQITTHSTFMSKVEFSITPRLKLALNINLILAYSVVREALDLARGAHHDLDTEEDIKERKAQGTEVPGAPAENEADPKLVDPPREVSGEVYTVESLLERALIKIDLPSDDQVMIELCAARVIVDWMSNPTLQAKSLRMFSEHPFQRGAWCVVMSLVNLKAEFNTLYPEIKDKINLDLDGFRINIPFKFKLYRIIDNGITLSKAIKTLLLQTKLHNTTLSLNPKVIKKVPNVPRTRIRSKQLLVSLEDDYFESDLTLIMLVQQQASESRRHKTYEFDRKVKTMLRTGLKQLADDTNLRYAPNRKHTFAFHHEQHHSDSDSFKDAPQSTGAEDNKDRGSPVPGKSRNSPFSNKEHSSPVPNSDRGSSPFANGDQHSRNHFTAAVHDGVDHISSGVRHRSTKVFHEAHTFTHHAHTTADKHPRSEDHSSIAHTLMHIPKAKIEALLTTGMELGTPTYDSDKVLHTEPWLDFWANPEFEPFRKLSVPLQNGHPSNMNIDEARIALLKDFNRMWIDVITQARLTQHLGAQRTRNEVVVDEMDPETCKEERIVGYSQKPLLFAVDFRKLDLTIAKTEHGTNEQLHKFLHDIGKGLPTNTEFSILVPLYLDLKAQGGLNVKVKDFPLPVLNFPPLARHQDPTNNCALRIRGNLIVTEQMMHSKENIRRLFVPLKPLVKADSRKAGPDILEVHRTLTPIKTFTDLSFSVESTYPTRFCWCSAYKPGFHGVGEGFSGFSKPPIDPSPVLGFWDKVRLTLHARFRFDLPKSPLCLTMKAGKSPYTLLNDDSGFIFAWKNNTKVEINPNDDPRSLFVFTSDKFELIVPDYMKSENEFLHATPWVRAFPIRPNYENIGQPEKVVFNLAQQTTWKLGMIFEKTDTDSSYTNGRHWLRGRDSDFRPHYDVQLSMPEYITNVEEYDAYRGFRSDFIHMAISVVSTPVSVTNGVPFCAGEDSGSGPKNSCHLSPGVLHHFKAWKDQFRSEQWPPIKTGSMFPDPVRVRRNNRTFGTALSTAQYQIALTPLDISFFHQLGSHKVSQNHIRSTGLKGKIDSFVLDIHTRREPPSPSVLGVHLHGQRRWRMKTYLGEIDIKSVNVRVIEAKLRTQNTKTALRDLHVDDDYNDSDDGSDTGSSTTGYESSFQDPSATTANGHRNYGPRYIAHDYWVDQNDYTEVGQRPRAHSRVSGVKVYPFLYAPRFGFLRRTDFSRNAVHVDSDTGEVVQKFGDILVHDCKLSGERPDRVHANLLMRRRADLNQSVSDFRESLESLGTQSPTAAVKLRVKQLQELISIGELNISVLANQIKNYEDRARQEDKRLDGIKAAIKNDLESYVYTEKEREKVEQEFRSPDIDRELSAYQGVYRDSGEFDEDEDARLNTFINRFIFHSMHVTWNNSVRDLLFRLKVSWSERKELEYVRLRRAVQYLEDLVAKAEENVKANASDHAESNSLKLEKKASSQRRYDTQEHNGDENERLKTIFDRLQEVNEGEEAQRDHSVVFFTPRIQLISEKDPSKCVQLLARDIEAQIVDAYSEIGSTEIDDKIERRYAVLVNQARFFVIGEEDIQQTGIEALCLEQYSGEEHDSKSLWPPWLGIELCYEAQHLSQFVAIRAPAFGIRYDQPNELHVSSKDEGSSGPDNAIQVSVSDQTSSEDDNNGPEAEEEAKYDAAAEKLIEGEGTGGAGSEKGRHGKQKTKSLLANVVVDAPQLFITLDSHQFFACYMITVNLLTYQDPLVKQRQDAINRVYLMNDFSGEYRPSLMPIELLQKDIRSLYALQEQLQVKLLHESEQSTKERIHLMRLERQINRRTTQLMVLMRAFKSALRKNMDTEVQLLTRYSLFADSVVFQVLSETGSPILETFLQRLHFSRLTGEMGSTNHVSIGGIYSRNMLPKAVYSQVLASYEDPEAKVPLRDALRVRWTMLDRVGGIPVLDGIDVLLKPLHIQLEQRMADKLLDFAFPVKQSHQEQEQEKQRHNGKEDSESDGESDSDGTIHESDVTLTDEEGSDKETKALARRKAKKTRHKGLLHRILPGGGHDDQAEVDEMLNRASNFWSIRSLRIHPMKLMVSYKGRSSHNLLDLQNLLIPMREIRYENKMWTKLDVIMRLRSEVIKTLLGRSGSIMTNRLRRHKSHTDQDDRDLDLEALLSRHSANMASQLDGVKQLIHHSVIDSANTDNATPGAQASATKDPMNLLVPEHRLEAREHPDAVSAREIEKRQHHHIPLHHHRNQSNGNSVRSSSNGSRVADTSTSTSTSTATSTTGTASSGRQVPGTPRQSSTFRGFDTTRTEQPGSPGQLRKPQRNNTTGSFFGRKTKDIKEDDASEHSEISGKSNHFLGKLKKQFS